MCEHFLVLFIITIITNLFTIKKVKIIFSMEKRTLPNKSCDRFTSQYNVVYTNLLHTLKRDLSCLSHLLGELDSWFHISEDVYNPLHIQIASIGNKHLNNFKCEAPVEQDIMNSYITSLENVYCKLQLFIHLIVKFLNMSPPIAVAFTIAPNVTKPMYPSLSTICEMLWKRLEFLHHYLIGQVLNAEIDKSCKISKEQNSDNEKVSRGTQTALHSLIYCESCDLSTAMIKLLVKAIDSQSSKYNMKSTHVSRVRKQMQEEVFSLSEWGAMRLWIKAICADIATVAETLFKAQNCNIKLQQNIKRQRAQISYDLKTSKSKILLLETTVYDNNKKLSAEQIQINQLKIEKEELIKLLQIKDEECSIIEKNKMECYEKLHKTEDRLSQAEISLIDKSKQMNSKLEEIDAEVGRKMLSLESALKISEANLAATRVELDVLKVENDLSKEKLASSVKEATNLKKELEKVETMFRAESDIRNKMEKGTNLYLQEFQCIKNEKVKCEEEIKNLKVQLEAANVKLKESRDNEQLLLHFPERVVPQFKLKGDPLTDMEAQRRANKHRIKYLLQENETLKSTIIKMNKSSST